MREPELVGLNKQNKDQRKTHKGTRVNFWVIPSTSHSDFSHRKTKRLCQSNYSIGAQFYG